VQTGNWVKSSLGSGQFIIDSTLRFQRRYEAVWSRLPPVWSRPLPALTGKSTSAASLASETCSEALSASTDDASDDERDVDVVTKATHLRHASLRVGVVRRVRVPLDREADRREPPHQHQQQQRRERHLLRVRRLAVRRDRLVVVVDNVFANIINVIKYFDVANVVAKIVSAVIVVAVDNVVANIVNIVNFIYVVNVVNESLPPESVK